jgi:flagellar protein FliT
MMNSPQIITTYETILAITGQMLEAARSGDWDRLVALEKDCKKLVEGLIAENYGLPLSSQLQQRKAEIIRKVLADDAEIRNITEPWMAQLQNLLSSAGRERKLSEAYAPGSSG